MTKFKKKFVWINILYKVFSLSFLFNIYTYYKKFMRFIYSLCTQLYLGKPRAYWSVNEKHIFTKFLKIVDFL